MERGNAKIAFPFFKEQKRLTIQIEKQVRA
jgi:hypothetical protein